MYIDIEKAKKAFKEYVKNYNPEDKQVKLKISHMERTSQIAKNMAKSLELEQEDIELAELIGLLHDIGRFEQIKRYHTWLDKNSINHGEFGVKLLFEENLIKKFINTSKYDDIIRLAILNHNRGKIEEGLTARQNLHARIIRDSDKTDIFYTLTFEDIKSMYGKDDISEEKISDEIYREFKEDKIMNYKYLNTGADILVAHFAYIYDFNFDYGIKVIQEKKEIDKLYNRFTFKDEETMKRYNEVYRLSKEYAINRC